MPRYDDDDDDRPRRRRPRDDDEDDDDRPRSRRRAFEDDDYDRPRRKKKARPRAKEMSTLGAIGLGIGGLALVVSIFMPCFASYSLVVSGIGIVVGFIALALAQKTDGRQGYGMPIAAMSVSFVAVLVALGWLYAGKWFGKKAEEFGARMEVEAAKEEAKRKTELAKAATEVKAATPEGVVRVSAVQFCQAYENDEGADRLYKNKVIEVTGVFHEVDLTGEEGYVVQLKGGPNPFDLVHCNFAKDPDTRAKLTQLQPGQTVTIRGKCLGFGPILEMCIIVQ